MAWGKNGTTTLSGSGDVLSISDMTATKFAVMLINEIADGGGTIDNQAVTYNGNTNTVYARRMSTDGQSDATAVSQNSNMWGTGNIAHDHFRVEYMCSISGEEKLMIGWDIRQGTVGAGGVPSRQEQVGKFVPSPDADVTSITDTNGGTGDFDTGSNLSVLGSDLTPAAAVAPKVQDGLIFYETDTNKEYVLYDNTWTEL